MSNFAELYLNKKTVACIGRTSLHGESIYPDVFDVVRCAIGCGLCDQLARYQTCVVCPNVAEEIDVIRILLVYISKPFRVQIQSFNFVL